MNFAEVLHKNRIEKQITQQELADTLYVTRQTVSRWEKGHNYPTLDMLVEICRVLDIEINDVFKPQNTSRVLPTVQKNTSIPWIFRMFFFLIGLLFAGIPFICLLIFGKIKNIKAINRFNPFIFK